MAPFQILFLSGLGLTIGLKSTLQFFTKPKNYKVWQPQTFLYMFHLHFVISGYLLCWTGYYVIWCWLFLGSHWVAFYWHALRGIWLCCTLQVICFLLNSLHFSFKTPTSCIQYISHILPYNHYIFFNDWFNKIGCTWLLTQILLQWILANACCFPAKDSCNWMDFSTTIYHISK